jgi:hypothetical protein
VLHLCACGILHVEVHVREVQDAQSANLLILGVGFSFGLRARDSVGTDQGLGSRVWGLEFGVYNLAYKD